jgi:hypothetical protein
MGEFFLQIFNDSNFIYSVIIEDDNRVAYAYLLEDDIVIGDVWLYNQTEAPSNQEWKEQDMPFLNPLKFIKTDISILPINYANEVSCKWCEDIDGKVEVVISIRNSIIAKISSGSNPGWSTIVSQDGPLAKVY